MPLFGTPTALFAIESGLGRFDDFPMFFLLVLFLFGFFLAVLLLFLLGFLVNLFLGQVVLSVTRLFASFLVKFGMVFLVRFFALFFKDGSADVGIRFGPRVRLFVLGFHQSRRKRGKLLLTKAGGSIVMLLGVHFLAMLFEALFLARGRLFRRFGSGDFFPLCAAGSGCFAFRFGVREDPVRQASGETPRHTRVRLHADRRTCGLLVKIGLALLGLVVSQRLDRRWQRTPAILGERFTRQDDVVLFPVDRHVRAAITRRSAIVKTARITFALGRSVLRGRQIPSARSAMTSPSITIPAATPASPASSPPASAIPATIAAVSSAVVTRPSIVSNPRRIIPRGVVGGSKILGSGGIRIRLALLGFGNSQFHAGFFAARHIS